MRSVGVHTVQTSYSHSSSATSYYTRIELQCKTGVNCYCLNLTAFCADYKALKSTVRIVNAEKEFT